MVLHKGTARMSKLWTWNVLCPRCGNDTDRERRHTCGLKRESHQQSEVAASNCSKREQRDRSFSCKDIQEGWQQRLLDDACKNLSLGSKYYFQINRDCEAAEHLIKTNVFFFFFVDRNYMNNN